MKIKISLKHQIIHGFTFSSIQSDNFIITIDENLNLQNSQFQIQKYPKMSYEGPKEFRKFYQLLNRVNNDLKGNIFNESRATISPVN